jgi:phosphatidylcholine synthase
MTVETRPSPVRRSLGYAAHVYTASGVVFAFLAAREIFDDAPDPRRVFVWLAAAGAIDATDGWLARRVDVSRTAPSISGRTIDDLLDYLTFVFLPLVLLDRMQWLPAGWGWTVVPAMGASLLGFAHVNAKFEEEGFFRGFPSYWNIFVFYAGWFSTRFDPWVTAVLLWILTILTVSPIRLLYPNRTPDPWRTPLIVGGAIWLLLVLFALRTYPGTSAALMSVTLLYPAFYTVASVACDRQARRP